MAQFSGAVKIGDLNDFIAPSQACVVSLQGQKQPAAAAQQAPPPTPPLAPAEGLQLNARASKRQAPRKQQAVPAGGGPASSDASADTNAPQQLPPQQPQQAKGSSSGGGGFQQTVVTADTQAVKVSLNDCLACSGCVTSAETVLLQAQSLQEFVGRCEDADAHVVVSISPQSRASLAALHGIPAAEVQGRVAAFLRHHLSVALVLDTGLGTSLALAESGAEFMTRHRQAAQQRQAANVSGEAGSDAAPLPMLASACPGWVCYAEKTHGATILPHIATTRSPQGIIGALVKRCLAPARGWDPARVYHVTVMPCYDKKLEASRDDFLVPGTSVAEVDSSLTTGELQELLDKYGVGDLSALPPGRSDDLAKLLLSAGPHQQQQQQQQQQQVLRAAEPLAHAQPGSSGGYAEYIFAAAAQQLYGVDVAAALQQARDPCAAAAPPGHHQQQQQQQANGTGTATATVSSVGIGDSSGSGSSSSPPAQLPFAALRNADLAELVLQGPDGAPLLRVARAYGFRNIQAIVRQIRGGRCPYDYVEVMACPSGCLNGGGQAKPGPGMSQAQLLEAAELAFFREQQQQQQQQQQQPMQQQCQQQQQQQQQQQYRVAPGVIQVLQQVPGPGHQHQQQSPLLPVLPPGVSAARLQVLYQQLLGVGCWPGSAAARGLLHTQYHKREKSVTSTLSDW